MSLVKHNRTTVAKPTRNILKTRKTKKNETRLQKERRGQHSIANKPCPAAKLRSTRYRPGGGETICPADSRSTVAYRFAANQAVKYPKIFADLRPSAAGSAVRTSLAAGGG